MHKASHRHESTFVGRSHTMRWTFSEPIIVIYDCRIQCSKALCAVRISNALNDHCANIDRQQKINLAENKRIEKRAYEHRHRYERTEIILKMFYAAVVTFYFSRSFSLFGVLFVGSPNQVKYFKWHFEYFLFNYIFIAVCATEYE